MERVGQLLVLPRESLRERFGGEVLLRLDQAFGRISETVVPLREEEAPVVRRVFEGATVSLEGIFLTVQEMLGELAGMLESRESGVRGLRLEWVRFNAGPVSRELVVGLATRDSRHLWKLLRPKVEQMHLGYGVEAMVLTAFWVEGMEHKQAGMWKGAEDGERRDREFAEFLDRVVNRWGARRVLRGVAVGSHVPEVARGFGEEAQRHKGTEALRGKIMRNRGNEEMRRRELVLLDRPTVLLEPEPVEVVALQPDCAPSRVWWRGRCWTCGRGAGRSGSRRHGGSRGGCGQRCGIITRCGRMWGGCGCSGSGGAGGGLCRGCGDEQ